MTETVLRLVLPLDDNETVTEPDALAADALGDGAYDGAGDAPADGAGDAEPDGPGDAPTLPGLNVGPAERAAVLARHWQLMITESARRSMDRPGSVLTDPPPSIGHIAAYYRAAPWVPAHHESGALRAAGRAYGYAVALPVVAALYSLAWLFARPVRIGVVLLIVGAVTLAALV